MRTKISRWMTPSLIAMSLSGVLLSQASYADVELPIVPASVMKQSATCKSTGSNQYGFNGCANNATDDTGVNELIPVATWSSESDCDAV